MRIVLAASLALVLTGTGSAFAGSHANIASNTCWGAGGTNSASFACNSNSGSNIFYISVVGPLSLPQLTQVNVGFYVQVQPAVLPPWWLVQTSGCRAGAAFVDFAPGNMDGACPDIWGGIPPDVIVTVQNGVGAPSRLRVLGSALIPDGAVTDVEADANTELNVCRLVLTHAKSAGTGSCPGCNVAACFAIGYVELMESGGLGGADVYPGATGNWWVNWNGGFPSGTCQFATPVRNRTWGAVKSLYR